MIEVTNQFARNLMFWVLTLPFLYLFLAPAMMDVSKMNVPQSEVQLLADLGQDPAEITNRTDAVFTSIFVNTGAVRWANKLFTTNRRFGKTPKAVVHSDRANNTYLEGFWKMLYRGMWRIVGLGPILMVLMVCLVGPAIVDGLVYRQKKTDIFKPHNPVFFWASAHSAVGTIGIFLVLPILPFEIGFLALYGSVLLVAGSVWVTASNMQTGM